MIVAGATAYSRIWDSVPFARSPTRSARFPGRRGPLIGLVAGGAHPNPVEHAHVVTATTHNTLRGPRGR